MDTKCVQQRRDCMGLPLTCSSEEALRYFNRALVTYVTQRSTPLADVSRACDLDHLLTLGHCFLGVYWLYDGKHPADEMVSSHVRAVKTCKGPGCNLTEREEAHVRAFLAAAAGNLHGAVSEWSSILLRYPLDILAMHLFFQYGMLTGGFELEKETFAAILPYWREDMPLYPVILANVSYYACVVTLLHACVYARMNYCHTFKPHHE